MVRLTEQAAGVAYPKLDRDQIDLILECTLATIRDRDLGARLNDAEQVAGYLTAFYTKRWGLPPAISRRVNRRD